MNNKEEYIKELEEVIRKFLEPMRGIPFSVAIKPLTGLNVLTFDLNTDENQELLKKLSKSAQLSGQMAFEEGILTERPNEAGNHIEPFVIKSLRMVGLKADKPVSKSGKKKAVGYPDIQIEDNIRRTIYLDCKTYNIKTKDQGFRTFYFSPSEDPKITKDAFHLLMSFELDIMKRKNKNAFVPISWQIYTLDKLVIQIKHEFNASNRDLYTKEALLTEGKIRG